MVDFTASDICASFISNSRRASKNLIKAGKIGFDLNNQDSKKMKIGYVRIGDYVKFTDESQRFALHKAGCQNIINDNQQSNGSGLTSALELLNKDDVLVVKGFEILGKTVKGLVELINDLHSRSINLIALEDCVDTGTVEGRFLVHVTERLLLMNKALNNERTHLSLAVGKAKGRLGGRPPALTPEQKDKAHAMIFAGVPVREVAKQIGSNQATIYRLVGAKPI